MAGATPAAGDFDKVGEHLFVVAVEPKLSIGEFRECTGLTAEREILEHTSAGQNDFVYKLPGRLKWPNIVLKRGSTKQKDLLQWFWEARETPPKLRTVTLTLLTPTGEDAQRWAFQGAYPVKWTGPNLNAGSDAAATETLEIAHSGLVSV